MVNFPIQYKRKNIRNNWQGFLFSILPVLRFAIFGFIPLVFGLLMAFLPMKYNFDINDRAFMQ